MVSAKILSNVFGAYSMLLVRRFTMGPINVILSLSTASGGEDLHHELVIPVTARKKSTFS